MECLRALGALSPGSYGASCKVSYKDSVKVSKKNDPTLSAFQGLGAQGLRNFGLACGCSGALGFRTVFGSINDAFVGCLQVIMVMYIRTLRHYITGYSYP